MTGKSEIDAAERWLIGWLIDNSKPMRLTSAMASAKRAGHRWRAVLGARFRPSNGIVASRDSDGEWTWALQSDATAPERAAA
jgi:hypothetical protein